MPEAVAHGTGQSRNFLLWVMPTGQTTEGTHFVLGGKADTPTPNPSNALLTDFQPKVNPVTSTYNVLKEGKHYSITANVTERLKLPLEYWEEGPTGYYQSEHSRQQTWTVQPGKHLFNKMEAKSILPETPITLHSGPLEQYNIPEEMEIGRIKAKGYSDFISVPGSWDTAPPKEEWNIYAIRFKGTPYISAWRYRFVWAPSMWDNKLEIMSFPIIDKSELTVQDLANNYSDISKWKRIYPNMFTLPSLNVFTNPHGLGSYSELYQPTLVSKAGDDLLIVGNLGHPHYVPGDLTPQVYTHITASPFIFEGYYPQLGSTDDRHNDFAVFTIKDKVEE